MGSAHAFFRGLIATAAGSVAVASFLLRPPATGRGNERWRRSAAALARLSLAVVPPAAGVACARLRFSAAIKAITGGRVMTSQTDRGANSRPEFIMDPAGIPCREVSDALREAVEANQSKRFKK